MTEPKRQKPEMETTESYRGPLRDTQNVERMFRAANDNNPSNYASTDEQVQRQQPKRVPRAEPERHNSRVRSPASRLEEKISQIPNISGVAAAVTATAKIARIGVYLYALQVILWAINLVGLISLAAIEESWVMYLDVFGISNIGAESIFFVSMALLFLIGLSTLILAIGTYITNKPIRVKISGDLSIWIAAACLTLYLAPVINLVPWMIFWCLYVVKSQVNS